ncbi:hypothetical protein D3C72_2187960 [compost metagenome]
MLKFGAISAEAVALMMVAVQAEMTEIWDVEAVTTVVAETIAAEATVMTVAEMIAAAVAVILETAVK